MASIENPHSGQGPVLLNIGGDIGALVVTTPAEMTGLEIEIIPSGTDNRTGSGHHHDHHDDHHDDDHHDDDHHEDDHPHGHSHSVGTPPHVAVVPRPLGNRMIPSAVFGDLVSGDYDLYVRPDGPVLLTVSITGGQVTQVDWPEML